MAPLSFKHLFGAYLCIYLAQKYNLLQSGLRGYYDNSKANAACREISSAVSNSTVYYPGNPQYDQHIAHWVVSSDEQSACSVEPTSVEDLSTVLRIVGRKRVPFAIKGGGRTAHKGFSSTKGVHIQMSKFSDIVYHTETALVDIGAGLPWDPVYDHLKSHGVSVAGGRVSGVGVAGFLLGGGLSWKSNMYGLGIDSIEGFELVLPNGTFAVANRQVNDDLFFALKGGMNNFGIVTKFIMRTFPQTDVWAGVITVPEPSIPEANLALAAYGAEVTDPKAAINAEYIYYMGQLLIRILVFYDAPNPEEGIFDGLLALPGCQVEVSTTDFVTFNTLGLPFTGGKHVTFGTAPVEKFTLHFLESVANQTKFWGTAIGPAFVMNIVEFFLPDYFSHGDSSAYPDDRSIHSQPISSYMAWDQEENDTRNHKAMNTMTDNLIQSALDEGQDVQEHVSYGNIAASDVSLEKLYGKNLPRLKEIRKKYDPKDIMGLAGGYKIPPA